MSRVVRKAIPFRWDVIRPFESSSGRPSRVRMIDRNWYSSRFPSIATLRPRSASKFVGWRTTIGVRRTPMAEFPYRIARYGFSPTSSMMRNRLPGWRRERPGIPILRNRFEERQGLSFRKAQEELPDVFAEVLSVDELAPVFAVVHDRARTGVELHAVILDARQDRVSIPRDFYIPRIDSFRPIEPARIDEPSERRLDKRVLRHVGPEVFERERSKANVRGTRLFPERLDPLHRARLLLGLDPEHSQDLETVLRRISVEVIVEETVDGLRLGGDLLHAGHPGGDLLLAVAIVVPRVLAVAVPPQVRHR